MSKTFSDAFCDYALIEKDELEVAHVLKLVLGAEITATDKERTLANVFRQDADRVIVKAAEKREKAAQRKAQWRERQLAAAGTVSQNVPETKRDTASVTGTNGDSADGTNVTPISISPSTVHSVSQKEKINNTSIIKKESRFSKPTVAEIQAYCADRNNGVDAERFFDYYEANGWKVGKNAMKDWKATVRTWERNNSNSSQVQQPAAGEAQLTCVQAEAVYALLVEKHGMPDNRREGIAMPVQDLKHDIDQFIMDQHREKGLDVPRDYFARLRWLFANFPDCKAAANTHGGN